jgi:hypothetical protein
MTAVHDPTASHDQPPASPPAATPVAAPAASPTTYVLPTAILMAGALLLVVSMFLPYWRMTLHAPQYPKGLTVELYVNRMAGDVAEIDGLNHYIGMPRLEEAAEFERSFAIIAVSSLALLLLAAVFIQNWWAGLLSLPVVLYPAIFLADLYFWLYRFGHDLDPKAPLSTSIKPFTPAILGEGRVGQFSTTASLEAGFLLAVAAALVVLVGLYLHRRAYKPLVDARRQARQATAATGTRP